MKIIVYDTETTGLPKKSSVPPRIEEESFYPYIVQLSYIMYDTEENKLLKIYDNVVKIPENIVISEESIKLHGITREIMDEKGIPITDGLKSFLEDANTAELIVGHNVSFDNMMIQIEMLRNNFTNLDLFSRSQRFYCTMKNTVELCGIKTCYKNSTKTYNKFPKLIELYNHLFTLSPTKLHNSLNDVVLCLQCFCKIKFNVDIAETNAEVKQMIEHIM